MTSRAGPPSAVTSSARSERRWICSIVRAIPSTTAPAAPCTLKVLGDAIEEVLDPVADRGHQQRLGAREVAVHGLSGDREAAGDL
ncbi:MAG: hypothetical protein R2789_14905 [Microthrixaceae bacterium]